ncbi:MAG: hypothetical protein M1813_006350 [Trichoglossum hirsutum]|nr:MAG: hypothetical protein M1813_006350 [Trichoglossum hirsutum]
MSTSSSAQTSPSDASSLSDYDPGMWRARANSNKRGVPRIQDMRGETKMMFRGVIEGLRSGIYTSVDVLFVTWENDDMNCSAEIGPLKDVLEGKFQFLTQSYKIPQQGSMQALTRRLSEFVSANNRDNLTIFYYAGHGYVGYETRKLKFAAKAVPNTQGNSTIFYQDILDTLKHVQGDLLLILDTCYAGGATYHHKLRTRVELLAATAHDRMAPSPAKPGSFTPLLVKKLKLLLKKKPHGFLVSELFESFDYDDQVTIKPRWYLQSEIDYGRLVLRPQKRHRSQSTEATLHLCLRLEEPPDARVLQDIAKNLQIIPHVRDISIGDLNAPPETIKEIMKMVNVAGMFRRWAKRTRTKLEESSKSLALYDLAGGSSFKLKPVGQKLELVQGEGPNGAGPQTIPLEGQDSLPMNYTNPASITSYSSLNPDPLLVGIADTKPNISESQPDPSPHSLQTGDAILAGELTEHPNGQLENVQHENANHHGVKRHAGEAPDAEEIPRVKRARSM